MNERRIFWLTLVYFGVRLFSYIFQPSTPLHGSSVVNSVVSLLLLLTAIILLLKRDERGWWIICGELLLGGMGANLQIASLSLRTCLLIASLGIYFGFTIWDKNIRTLGRGWFQIFILIILLAAAFGATHGIYAGHASGLVIADTIPYLFFLYYLPLRDLLKLTSFKSFAVDAIAAAVISNFIFTLFTFAGFSSGMFAMQDSYYHWFRDVAGGRITDLGMNFYRIILNEQLLLLPALIYIVNEYIVMNLKKYFVFACLLLAILAVNLTRIYLLALIVGLLVLFTRRAWKRWLATSAILIFVFVLSFTLIHLVASRGASLGWELFGIRLGSIASPASEDSSLSRLLLLPKILEKIRANPMLGYGLGDTVTVFSPVFRREVTTPNFDWGYLEIWDELGLVGLLIWLSLLGWAALKLKNKPGSLAILTAYLVINLTSPALFHVMGTLLIATLLAGLALPEPVFSDNNIRGGVVTLD